MGEGVKNEKEAAGWGACAGSAWNAAGPSSGVPQEPMLCSCSGPRVREACAGHGWAAGSGGVSDQTWQEGRQDCSPAPVCGAHTFPPWRPSP